MEDCRRCGARVVANAPWCAQCHTRVPVVNQAALLEELNQTLAHAHNTALRLRHERVQPVHSRWHVGPLSFGPAAKGAVTAALGFVCLAAIRLAVGFPAPFTTFVAFITCAGSGIVLRDIWRRVRVR